MNRVPSRRLERAGRPQPRRVAWTFGIALALAGCNEAPTASRPAQPASAPTRAAAPIAPEDLAVNARIIELKNRLKADPYAADARLALGLALLERAELTAAEAEMARALELGLDPNLVLPPLARTWNLLGRSRELIAAHAETRLGQPGPAAELKAALALAYATTGNAAKARQLVAEALKDDPQSPGPRVLQAEIAMTDGRVDEALGLLDDTLAAHPGATDGWRLKGDILLFARNDVAGATAAFEKALETDRRHLPTHAKLVAMALGSMDLETARSRLDRLARVAPGLVQTQYFEARLAEARGDFRAARDIIQSVLAGAPEDLRSLLLAASLELKAGSLRTAQDWLDKAFAIAPGLPRTRHLMAQAHLRSGAPEKAQAILEPLVGNGSTDAVALGLSAEAALQAGLTMRATRMFERAAAADPGNARYRSALAIARINRGDVEGGFADLEAVAASDRTILGDMALLTARLRMGDQAAAIRAAQAVARKQQDRPLPHWLLGRLVLQAGDRTEARRHFDRALERDRAFAPAAVALAAMDLDDGDTTSARRRIDAVLEVNPRNLDAMLALARLRQRAGEPPAVVAAALEAAVRAHPGHPRARLAQIDYHVRIGDGAAALQAAQAAADALPRDLNILDALGRAQLASGESAQALGTFRRLVSARPGAAEPHLRMADIYLLRNETASALESLRTAVSLKPDLLAAQARLAGLATQAKNWPEALRVARDVQRQRPTRPDGFHLEGLVHAALQQWDKAIASFRQALALGGSTEVALQLHGALLGAGRRAEAATLAERWIAEHPKDNRFVGHLADLALVGRDLAGAERHYRAILGTDPGNVDAMNNLAWVLVEQAKPEALTLARRAAELQPRRADVLDTLSMALLADGQLAAALTNQKKAVELDPETPMLRLHLARLALDAKDFPTARVELDKLSALGRDFPAQAEVFQLRKRLP